jgi:DHA2 family multidrug resistance protein-like MFS transporter
MVAAAIPDGLSAEQAAAARDTLGGALSVASQMPDPSAAATLVFTAQQALTTAVQVTSAIGAVISIGSAIAVVVYLAAPRAESHESCEPELALAA